MIKIVMIVENEHASSLPLKDWAYNAVLKKNKDFKVTYFDVEQKENFDEIFVPGLDWEKAEKYLSEIRLMYTEIGVSGVMALRVVINPLLFRFSAGDRSEQLFNEIMALE